jgi:hypothetical protein
MSQRIVIDSKAFARDASLLQGELPVESLGRVLDLLIGSGGSLQYRVEGLLHITLQLLRHLGFQQIAKCLHLVPLQAVFDVVRHKNQQDIGHEAKIGRISDEAVFYLMSRGISEEDARAMIVSGFADNVSKELPLEYAVEMNNLIRLEMKGSIG